MKKKIKDLTLEEFDKICEKYDFCDDCPFYVGEGICLIDLALIWKNKNKNKNKK